MANIIESQVTLEDEVFEETIDVAEEPIEVVRPSSYNDLQDLPQVNGVTLQGNKTSSDLGIVTQNDINSAVSAEATLRENADTALGGRIDQEITARGNADTALGGRIDGEITNRTNADNALGTRIDNEILARQGGDNNLQSQIDAITSKSDVVDVVATYADLQAYDTQHLGNNDVIKVLDDETHDDAQTYYRWNKTAGTWSYIGSEAPYYSKGQMDTMLQAKQDKIDATHKLSADLVTDTSTTNKFVTAEDKTAWNAKQNALTAGQGIDITSDVISTPALVPEVVAELPTTGAEGKLYLTPKNYTTGTATGNPITISLGEDAGQITSAQLDGDTFQQSYEGKNFADISNLSVNSYTGMTPNITNLVENTGSFDLVLSGTANESLWSIFAITPEIQLEPNTKYTLSRTFNTTGTAYAGAGGIRAKNGSSFTATSTADHITFLTDSTGKAQLLFYAAYNQSGPISSVNSTVSFANVQLEKSATATSFEPYVGGVPSPNPSYPQNINVVTGTQTVSVNGTNYTVNLGDIELCKLDTYQDYIYKDGDDWKVHKDIGKYQFKGSEPWVRSGATTSDVFVAVIATALQDYLKVKDRTTLKSPYFIQHDPVSSAGGQMDAYNGAATAPTSFGLSFNATSITNITDATTWIINNKPTVYSAINNPADTIITDQTLIAQLEAIRTASLQNGANTITNTATGSNLAGDMEIGYYGYNPRNRYDKWLWLDINNEYEQIGS